jgi:hypothetical protein
MKIFAMPARPEDNFRVATEGGRHFSATGEYVDLSEFWWHQRLAAGDIRQGTPDEEEAHLARQGSSAEADADLLKAEAEAKAKAKAEAEAQARKK